MISIRALVLVIGIGFLAPKAAAQSDKYSVVITPSQPRKLHGESALLALPFEPEPVTKKKANA